MSKYFQATVDIKQKIEAIGGRPFTLSEDWLKNPSNYPDYSTNILQAVWNIAHTIQEALKEKHPQWYLFGKRSEFTRWFHYLEPDTGTPLIDDDTSYQLGCALHNFLDITTTDSEAARILTSSVAKLIGIDPMAQLKTSSVLLAEGRLPDYLTLKAYKEQIATAIAAQSKPIPPRCINTTTDPWTYELILSTDKAPTAGAEAERSSYLALIEELQTYIHKLAAQEKKLGDQRNTFETTHPVSSDTTDKRRREFLTIRGAAFVELGNQYNNAVKQHKSAQALLFTARKALHKINDMLSKSSNEQQEEVLVSLAKRMEKTSSIATNSLENYLAAKRIADDMPPSNKDNLGDIETKANTRRTSLETRTTELQAFIDMMSRTPPTIPPATDLIRCLEGNDTEISRLHAAAQAACEKLTKKKSFIKSLFNRSKNTVLINSLSALSASIKHRLMEIQTELKIDVTLTETTEPTAPTPAAGTLYALQKQYQAEKQYQAAHNLVLLSELQSRQDSMEYRQALLVHSLTTLEFSLKTLLVEIPLDATLDCLDDHDTIIEINEWLEATASKQQSTQKLRDAFLAQKIQWRELDELYTNIHVEIPISTATTKATLLQEYKGLEARITAVHEQYKKLQALVVQTPPQDTAALPNADIKALPLLPEEPHPTLSTTFFGTIQGEIGGVFGDYIKERADTYWFRDLFSQFTALIFGCCAYQTEAAARGEYITELQRKVGSYQTDHETYSDLQDFIDGGLKTFSPRTNNGNDYKKSLHYKLRDFKMGLAAMHTQATNDEIKEQHITTSYM